MASGASASAIAAAGGVTSPAPRPAGRPGGAVSSVVIDGLLLVAAAVSAIVCGPGAAMPWALALALIVHLFGSGWALTRWLPLPSSLRPALSIGLSLSLLVLAACLGLWLGRWAPLSVHRGICALTVVLLGWSVWRGRPWGTAIRARPRTTDAAPRADHDHAALVADHDRGAASADPTGGLLRDGVALAGSALLTAVAGLVGWALTAKMVHPDHVGLGAAAVSTILLVATIADLGLGPALLRWLPRSGAKAPRLLSRVYLTVGSLAVVAGGIAAWLRPAQLSGVTGGSAALLMIGGLAWALFQLQDSVLVGLGRATWVPIENALFSALRLGLVVALVPALGAAGIVVSWALPAALGVAVLTPLIGRVARARRAAPTDALPDRREISGLLGPIYPSGIAVSLLYNAVPVIVTARFGPTAGAAFFLVWQGFSALDYAVTSFASALVVRASTAADQAGRLTRAAATRVALVFAPLLAIGALVGPAALRWFGPTYADHAASLLWLVLAAFPFRATIVLACGRALAAGRGIVVGTVHTSAALAIGACVLLVPTGAGLTPIGVALVLSQALLAALTLVLIRVRAAARSAARGVTS